MLPNLSFHTQHWYELDARAEIAMYDGTVDRDLPALEELFDGLERSVLLRLMTVRAMSLWIRGRLALHQRDAAGAAHAVARLAKVDNPRARVYSALVEAGIAGRSRDVTAIAKLREASALAERFDLRLHGAAARYQLGKLIGGTEGQEHVEAGELIMRSEGVANPERFATWFVPGLQK